LGDWLDTPLPLSDIEADLRQMVTALDQLHLQEDLLFGGSDHVFAGWTLRGIHTGHYGGIAPTHRAIAVQTAELYVVSGSVVTECWVCGDLTSLFDQLEGRR
jgi:hypothetical protein